MNHKEALFFIGKCLTLSHESENLQFVSTLVQSEQVDWDQVVQLSTAHYVFPALYHKLSQAKLLEHLPEELVAYMKHISDLNRARNLEILKQAEEINQVLRANNITPIFLKGTGFLLENLYSDIAERMTSDIDVLVSKEDLKKAVAILHQDGYTYVSESDNRSPAEKHYPRIQKEGRIAAVEVHFDMTTGKYKQEFNFSTINSTVLTKEGYSFLSIDDQLALTLIAKQINDDGQYQKTMSLRNAYDLFLLSQKTNSLDAIKKYNLLFHPLNGFLRLSQLVLNSPSIVFESNSHSDRFLKTAMRILEDETFRKRHYKKISKNVLRKSQLEIIFKAFYKKEYRQWLFKRLKDGREK